jgi:hypothetical protein
MFEMLSGSIYTADEFFRNQIGSSARENGAKEQPRVHPSTGPHRTRSCAWQLDHPSKSLGVRAATHDVANNGMAPVGGHEAGNDRDDCGVAFTFADSGRNFSWDIHENTWRRVASLAGQP